MFLKEFKSLCYIIAELYQNVEYRQPLYYWLLSTNPSLCLLATLWGCLVSGFPPASTLLVQWPQVAIVCKCKRTWTKPSQAWEDSCCKTVSRNLFHIPQGRTIEGNLKLKPNKIRFSEIWASPQRSSKVISPRFSSFNNCFYWTPAVCQVLC